MSEQNQKKRKLENEELPEILPMDGSEKIKTKMIKIKDINNFDPNLLTEAVECLRNGNTVAFPTETVYGLGGNALDEKSSSEIFRVKGRPSDNPLIVHVSSFEMLNSFIDQNSITPLAKSLMKSFWPGPLTILMKPLKGKVASNVTSNLPTVGVRMPSHPVALKLIEKCEFPIAAPSANLSGRPSPTSAQHCLNDLNGRVRFIIDGGETNVGLESTVVDVYNSPPLILRPGGITP